MLTLPSAAPRATPAVLLVAAMLGLPCTAHAQSASVGVLGGLNASTFDGFSPPGSVVLRREVAALVGVSVELPPRGWVTLQPEVVYAHKGAGVEGQAVAGAAPSVFLTDWLEYLEVPILFRLGANGGRRGLYGVVGPAVAWLVRAHERWNIPGVLTQDQDIKDQLTGVDVAVVAGGGVSVGRFDVEGRVDIGLRDLKPIDDRGPGDSALTNHSVAVLARLRF